jgi:hypothetical protein
MILWFKISISFVSTAKVGQYQRFYFPKSVKCAQESVNGLKKEDLGEWSCVKNELNIFIGALKQ